MDLAEATYRATEQFPEEERYSARLGFVSAELAASLLQTCDDVGRMLGGLRKSLRPRRARGARGSGLGARHERRDSGLGVRGSDMHIPNPEPLDGSSGPVG